MIINWEKLAVYFKYKIKNLLLSVNNHWVFSLTVCDGTEAILSHGSVHNTQEFMSKILLIRRNGNFM